MRHLTAIGILPLVLLPALPAQAQMVTISPEQIGQVFCIGMLGNDMSPVSGVMSDDLKSLIEAAFAKSNEYESSHPGEKPPMGDGVPWSTFPDYADGCTVGDASVQGEVATVQINYTFSEYPEANYANALILYPSYPENGPPYIWRIADVDLGDGNTLRQSVADTFEQ